MGPPARDHRCAKWPNTAAKAPQKTSSPRNDRSRNPYSKSGGSGAASELDGSTRSNPTQKTAYAISATIHGWREDRTLGRPASSRRANSAAAMAPSEPSTMLAKYQN